MKNIVVIADHLTDKGNIGMMLRVCEAFGVTKVFLCKHENIEVDQKIQRVSRHVLSRIELIQANNVNSVLQLLGTKSMEVVSLELCNGSEPIQFLEWESINDLCLIIGNEKQGINPETLAISDRVVHIPMYGQNTSMNVVQALSIGLYEITRYLAQ